MSNENFDNWLKEYRKPENFIPMLREKLRFIEDAKITNIKEIQTSRYFHFKEVDFEVSGKEGIIPSYQYHIIDTKNCVNVILLDIERDVLILIQEFSGASFLNEGLVFKLSLPGGVIDENETPLQAAIRETKEETGGNVKNIISFKNFYAALPGLRQKNYMFIAETDSSSLPEISGKAEENEVTNLIIVPFEHIKEVQKFSETESSGVIIALNYLDSYQKNEQGKIVKGYEIIKEKLNRI